MTRIDLTNTAALREIFQAGMERSEAKDFGDEALSIFDSIDTDNNETISRRELNAYFAALEEAAAEEEAAAAPEEAEEVQSAEPRQVRLEIVRINPETGEVIEQTQNEEAADESARLTAKDWGKSLWNSTKDFVKNMFCDENGKPSLKKIGIAAGITIGAGALAASGAVGMMIVGGASVIGGGVLGVKGVSNLVQGIKGINAATTREDKLAALDQTTDGIVETTVGVGMVIGGAKMIKKGYTLRVDAKNAEIAAENAKAQAKAEAEAAEAKALHEKLNRTITQRTGGTYQGRNWVGETVVDAEYVNGELKSITVSEPKDLEALRLGMDKSYKTFKISRTTEDGWSNYPELFDWAKRYGFKMDIR